MPTLRTFVTCLALALTACGGDPPNIGGTCTAAGGCDEDLQCNTTIPGGYCTAPCTTSGSTSECPDGSVCDSISGAAVTCVRVCKQATDCRADLDCNGVSGSNIKACKPKL